MQLSGAKWGSGLGKGVEVEAVPGGLILPEEAKIELIRLELSLGPICFFKNQAVKVSGYWGSTYGRLLDAGIWENESSMRVWALSAPRRSLGVGLAF